MKKNLVTVLLAAAALVGAPLAHGSGFLIYEHGAAAMAMGGAFVAVANNASTLFHNPAGMAFLPGTQISAGATFIIPTGSLRLPNYPTGAVTLNQADQVFYPPNFYLTHNFGRLAAGIGVFAPYGLGTSWPGTKDNPLRYLGYFNDMKTFFVNPAVAYKVTDNFSIGAGVSYIFSNITVKQVEPGAYSVLRWDMPVELKGDGTSFAFNAGALYKGKGFSVGANYRSGFNIDYEGDMVIETGEAPSLLRPMLPTQATGTTTFKFPSLFGVGAAFDLSPKMMLSVDAHYVMWNRYDQYVLKVTYKDGIKTGQTEDTVVSENWKDSFIFRTGFQYKLTDALALRLGALYDLTPQPVESMDPNLPDANRIALTGGLGYHFTPAFGVDLAYQYESFQDRESPNRSIYPANWGVGIYKTKASLIAVNFTYGF